MLKRVLTRNEMTTYHIVCYQIAFYRMDMLLLSQAQVLGGGDETDDTERCLKASK